VIVRSFRGVVVRGAGAEFYGIVRSRLRAFRGSYSMIESHVGRRSTPDGDHFLITTYWPDWDSLRTWARDDLLRPWGFDELLPYLASWEIEHFEELEIADAEAVQDS
jgi:hypothetical protein